MQECKRRIVSLKEFANESNFAQKAASINFGEIIKNLETSHEFGPLKEEPKTYDVLGFKVIVIQSIQRLRNVINLYFRC